MANLPSKSRQKKGQYCTCDHDTTQHNEAGCCAKVGMLDDGQSDLCRCMFKVRRDLDFGYPDTAPSLDPSGRIEAGYDTQAGY